jgi:hypothetical protein
LQFVLALLRLIGSKGPLARRGEFSVAAFVAGSSRRRFQLAERSLVMNVVSRRVAFAAAVALLAVAESNGAQAQGVVSVHGASFGPVGDTWQANSSQSWTGSIQFIGVAVGEGFQCCSDNLPCSYTANVNGTQHTMPVILHPGDGSTAYSGQVQNASGLFFTGAQYNTRIPVQVKLRCEYDIFGNGTYTNALANTYKMTFEVLIVGTQ